MALADGIRRDVPGGEGRAARRDHCVQRRSFPRNRSAQPVGSVTFWFKQQYNAKDSGRAYTSLCYLCSLASKSHLRWRLPLIAASLRQVAYL